MLARTPAPLLGISLDDLAGETEPVNVPGLPHEVFPSWSRRMARDVSDLATDPLVQRTLAAVRAVRA
jgi:4-alpha-glucanotransferase